MGADVILAKKLKRLVRRRNTFVSEAIDSLLPCRHAVLFIPAVTISTRTCGAAMASRRAYMMSRLDGLGNTMSMSKCSGHLGGDGCTAPRLGTSRILEGSSTNNGPS